VITDEKISVDDTDNKRRQNKEINGKEIWNKPINLFLVFTKRRKIVTPAV
jgi:hypothetical protein